MGIFDSFSNLLRGKLKSMEKMEEEAAINAIIRHGMLGARLYSMSNMDKEDYLQWSVEWCQAALPYLRIKRDTDTFEKVLCFLLNFEELYYPLKLRIDQYRIKEGDKEGQLREDCPKPLFMSYQKIEFRMVTDAKLLLAYSFDPEDVKPNTVVMNKPTIPVPYMGVKPTSELPGKPSSKARQKKQSEGL